MRCRCVSMAARLAARSDAAAKHDAIRDSRFINRNVSDAHWKTRRPACIVAGPEVRGLMNYNLVPRAGDGPEVCGSYWLSRAGHGQQPRAATQLWKHQVRMQRLHHPEDERRAQLCKHELISTRSV